MLDALYRDDADWLRSSLGRKLRVSSSDADDIVQDAYLKLASREPSRIDRPRAFLSQIALNLFRDRRRRAQVRTDHARAAAMLPRSEDHTHGLSEPEARVTMERLILSMPELYRDVFLLSRFRHMTNQTIADHLGVSIKTVEWRMSRALDFCVRQLEL